MTHKNSGPLAGIKIVEMEAIGPIPFCGQLLADLGAEIMRIDRLKQSHLGVPIPPKFDTLSRGRTSIAVDIKSDEGKEIVKKIVAGADVLMEGMRPGVMERLGFGPKDFEAVNPKLIYARSTGWGQEGERAHLAGHDINYISLNGTLASFGAKDGPPIIPLNMMGDYGGGALFTVIGILAAVIESKSSGKGQVIDAAMVDGSNYLMSVMNMLSKGGEWTDGKRGSNSLDGGWPFYSIYETNDKKHMAVGALEGKFYQELLKGLGLSPGEFKQGDVKGWDTMRQVFTETFKSKTQAEWTSIFENTDACTTPIITMAESEQNKINQNRGLYSLSGEVTVPTPAPRFSRTPATVAGPPVLAATHTVDVLEGLGLTGDQIQGLINKGIVRTNS